MSTTRTNHNTTNNNDTNKTQVPWEPYRAATGSSMTSPLSPPLILPHEKAHQKQHQQKHTLIEHSKSADASLAVHLNKDNLIRYKIRTNMEKFNAKRPGYEFSDSDFKQLEHENRSGHLSESVNELLVKNSIENTKKNLSTRLAQDLAHNDESNNSSQNIATTTGFQLANGKLLPSFVDARFYTDAQFLKLANQLKKSSLEQPPVSSQSQHHKKSKSTNLVTAEKAADNLSSTSSNVNSKEQYEARIEYLENQMKGIYEQLQIQTQVNVELKKMLVASISGEDLQYKLERLVNDKQRYEFELTSNRKEIQRLSEEVEQVSIQCDLWRTKFSASKLISDENFAWKSFLFMLNSHNEKIIRSLLSDNELVNFKLNQAVQLLLEFKDHERKQQHHHHHQSQKKTMNNLQAINVLLSNLASLGSTNRPGGTIDLTSLSPSMSSSKKVKTFNEIVAMEMLEQFDWIKLAIQSIRYTNEEKNGEFTNPTESLDKLEQLVRKIKAFKATKFSRLYQPDCLGDANLLLNVCTKCKGEIKVV